MISAARFNDPVNWGPALTEAVSARGWRKLPEALGLVDPRMRLTDAGREWISKPFPSEDELPPMTERLRAANEALAVAMREQSAAWMEWRFGPQTKEQE